MHPDIRKYNEAFNNPDREICEELSQIIDKALPNAESKIWHRHPVWFLDGNPIAGYAKLKKDVQLLFWSGQSFDEPGLEPEGSFKAAQKRYTDVSQIVAADLRRWLKKAQDIQWDYKHIVKNKGVLNRIK